MNPINNNNRNITFARSGAPGLANFITTMTKADAKPPIIALECFVTGGRTRMAKKRGGWEEARERIIEEVTGAVVWLWGVEVLNNFGDKILSKYLGTPGKNFDVGTDKVLRTPFKNYMKDSGVKKNITQNKVATLKFAKVCTSILIANLVIGFVVPRLNHYLTQVLLDKQKAKKIANNTLANSEASENETNKSSSSTTDSTAEKKAAVNTDNSKNGKDNINSTNTSKDENTKNNDINETINTKNSTTPNNSAVFKGLGVESLNAFTNAIENTNTGKLLSTDVGVTGGRVLSARRKEERIEYAFRDIVSIYFYMWASGHVANLLNLVESGRTTRLDPETSNILDDYLSKMIEKKGGSLSIEEFKKFALGMEDSAIELPKDIKFEEGELSFFEKLSNSLKKKQIEPLKVAKVSDLEGKFDEMTFARIKEMSKLQPLREGVSVVTKQQIIDAVNMAEINNPELLDKTFKNFTKGASADPYKYVSNDKLYKLKSRMKNYISDICKQAKDGKVSKEILEKAKNKNIMCNGINFAAGFAVSALFLSTLIPKMQYMITRKRTGLDVFPGTYDFEHNKRIDE